MNASPKIGIGVIVKRGEKVLLCKRIGHHGLNTWGFPGGHLEYGETFDECANRETMEETNIRIKNLSFFAATNDIFSDKHYVTLFILSEYYSGELKIMEPDKVEKWEWFTWDNLPEPLFLPIQNLITLGYNPFK